MTKNQIEYQKLKTDQEYKHQSIAIEAGKLGELKRSNLAQEELTRVRDTGTLNLRGKELEESRRHNQVVEIETERSHRTDETERNRHNVASEGIEASKAAAQHAQVGLGYAQLSEQNRHNVVLEGQNQQSLNYKQRELGLRGSELGIEMSKLAEVRRHNVAYEDIQQFEADLHKEQVDINKWRARFQNARDVVGLLDTIVDDLDQYQRTRLLEQYKSIFNLSGKELYYVRKLLER